MRVRVWNAGVRAERARVRIDTREIWICGDIDQVECSQGEYLAVAAPGFGEKQKITSASLSLHPRSRLPWLIYTTNRSFLPVFDRLKQHIYQRSFALQA